uniref:RNA-directed DNA polymerase n=1 Tax=Tetranychus urticae TaxID=32264 RepID=A0A158P4Y1_TETUR
MNLNQSLHCYQCNGVGHKKTDCPSRPIAPRSAGWSRETNVGESWRSPHYSRRQAYEEQPQTSSSYRRRGYTPDKNLSKSPPRSMRPPREESPSTSTARRRYRSPSPRARRRSKSRSKSPTNERKTKVVKAVYRGYSDEEDDDDGDVRRQVLSIISRIHKRKRDLTFANMKIKGKTVECLVDTGSQITILTKEIINKLELDYSKYKGPTNLTAGNAPLNVLGETYQNIIIYDALNEVEIKTPIIILNQLPCNIKGIIGFDVLQTGKFWIDCENAKLVINQAPARKIKLLEKALAKLLAERDDSTVSTRMSERSSITYPGDFGDNFSLISETKPSVKELVVSSMIKELKLEVNNEIKRETRRKLEELIQKYRPAFAATAKELGFSNVFVHQINTGSHPPISQKPYRMSEEKRKIAEKSINELIDEGIVVPSCSPWASPIVLVAKKGTEEVRLCVDYRKLNEITVKDKFPLPNIQDYLDSLQGMKYFTLLDLRSGYHQMALDPADQPKTAFVTPSGLYEYTRLPFGLANGPSSFMRMMSIVLGGLIYNTCLIFIDDLLIFSKNEEEHLERLETIFRRLIRAGLTLKPNKCSFFKQKILYLGHIVSEQGQEVDPEKIQKVQQFPTPRTVRDIKSFVALCSYYRRFIKDFALIARPLTNLTRKDLPFEWGPAQENAFNELKTKLTTPPVLAHYDPNKQTQLRVDASGYGLGAILLQKSDNGWHPIAFASRILRGAELNYPISDKECLAIVWAVQKFRVYLEGIKFEVVTDHCALCHIHSKKNLPARLQRYAMALQSFDFTVTYKSGKKHADVDCLSRYPISEIPVDNLKDECEELFTMLVEETTAESFDLITKQRQDPRCSKILNQLENLASLAPKERKRMNRFRIENGTLYRLTTNHYGETWNVVLPRELVPKVLEEYHDAMISGHPGLFSTYNKIKQFYWWPQMTKDITNHVKNCFTCQLDKRGSGTLEAPLKSIVVNNAFDKIGIDLVGPLPKSYGQQYIVVCTDYFTRWIEVEAIGDLMAETIAEFLVNKIFLRHGCPKTILSDQGRNFISSIVGEIKNFMGSKWSFSTSYHPATNGLTEKANQTVCTMLTHYCQNENRKKWARLIPVMGFAYNTSVNKSTKSSPFYLLYGRHPVLPIDIILNTKTFKSLPKTVRESISQWPQLRDQARLYSIESKENQKIQHDMKKLRDFNVGEEVMYRIYQGSKKLTPKFSGPYKIIEKLGKTTYRILPLGEKGKIKRAHGSQLKPFHRPIQNSQKVTSINRVEKIKPYRSFLSTSLILLMGLICLVAGQSNPFITGDTILWKETGYKPRKATQEIRLFLAFTNPCVEMMNFKADDFGEIRNRSHPGQGCRTLNYTCAPTRTYLFSLQDYCSNFIEEKYIKPIRFIPTIRPKEERSPQLIKRELLTSLAVGTTVIAVGGVVLTGVAWVYKTLMTPDLDFRPVLDAITAQNVEYQKALKKQNAHLMDIAKTLYDQRQQIELMKKLIPIVSFQAADIVTCSNAQLITMQKFNESITKPSPTIDPNFFKSLKVELNCDDCDLSVIEKISVKIHNEERYPILSLNFTTFRHDQIMKVFQADPFVLYKTNATHTCKSRYRGPEYLLVNTTTYQFCEIDESELKSPNPVFTKVTTCPNKFNRTQLWRDEHCVSKNVNETIVAEKIQVKNMGDHYLIHCAGHKIEIYSGIYPCPNQVIKLSKYTNFSIDDMKYTSNNFFIYVRGPRVTEHTQAINLKLFQPAYQEINIAPLEFELLEAAQEKVLSSFEKITLTWKFDYVKWISISLLVTICFLLCSLSVRFMFTPKRTVYSIVYDERDNRDKTKDKRQPEVIPLHKCY